MLNVRDISYPWRKQLKVHGLSLQHIADRLNADGVPTLSGRGRWQKGTISNLLARAEDDE